ncbi:hypothetical protein HDU96_004586 [Phlyctochytrium bullatum]|nr:hypothetical protein HDU96_004586 [Phlyctochytrium bullatum]
MATNPELIYNQYKKATADVSNWLRSFLKGVGPTDTMTVARILKATDLVKANRKAVPSKIMQSLDKAITLREKVAAKHKSPDEGHMRFVEVLKEVRGVFSRLVTKAKPTKRKGKQTEKEEDEDEPANRFSALSVEDAMTETDETFEKEPEPKPAALDARKEWEELDIIRDTEWFMIQCFIADLDNLMGHVRSAWDDFKEHSVPIFIPTAITNLAVSQVVKLSATLQLDYPHLTTLDHIIAVMYYEIEIDIIMMNYPHVTYSDAIEAIVLGRRDRLEKYIPKMAEAIKKKLQVSIDDATGLAYIIHKKEEILDSEGEFFQEYDSLIYFHHTQMGLVKFLEIYKPKMKLVLKDGISMGPKWNEKSNPAQTLSDLLMDYGAGNILPTMGILATYDLFEIQHQDIIIPLVNLFRDFLTKKTVGVETPFAWHAMLWATFIYQGDMRCSKLSVNSSLKMKNLKERVNKNMESGLFDSFNSRKLLRMAASWLDEMTDYCYSGLTPRERLIGLYNPYMAGQRLTMAYYKVAIDGGCFLIDSVSQMRMILHYYNAFRILGLIKELPLLEFLIEQFSKGKWLWVGGRPTEKGQFIKAFLLAWGYDVTSAGRYSKILRSESLEGMKKTRSSKQTGKGVRQVDPGLILKSYRPVVENIYIDFPRECFDDYKLFFEHLKKLMLDDYRHSLLTYDLISIGRIFLEIWNKLVPALGFELVMQENMAAFIPTVTMNEDWRDSRENYQKSCEVECLQYILALCDTDRDMDVVRIAVKVLEESIDGLREDEYRYDL